MVLDDEALAAGELVLLNRYNGNAVEVIWNRFRGKAESLFEGANVCFTVAAAIGRSLFDSFDRLVVVVVLSRCVVIRCHARSFSRICKARVVSNNFLQKATAPHYNNEDYQLFQRFEMRHI